MAKYLTYEVETKNYTPLDQFLKNMDRKLISLVALPRGPRHSTALDMISYSTGFVVWACLFLSCPGLIATVRKEVVKISSALSDHLSLTDGVTHPWTCTIYSVHKRSPLDTQKV